MSIGPVPRARTGGGSEQGGRSTGPGWYVGLECRQVGGGVGRGDREGNNQLISTCIHFYGETGFA